LALDPSAEDQIELYEAILDTQRRISGNDSPLGEAGLEAMYQLAQLHMGRGQTEEAQGYLDDLEEAAPEFRADDVAALRQRVEDIVANKPGEAVEVMGANHVQEGMSHGGYNSMPATSGPHYGREAEWGIHAEAVPDELTVHNLEHGGIAIQYRPDLEEATGPRAGSDLSQVDRGALSRPRQRHRAHGLGAHRQVRALQRRPRPRVRGRVCRPRTGADRLHGHGMVGLGFA